ncbi:hypothetical protein VDG1235_1953 [Verrucomicrobiia bacterium DG1235]|nr:hypothetical protein VDG1235_1953 [Verrucomicrobiae bacterium DG1235]
MKIWIQTLTCTLLFFFVAVASTEVLAQAIPVEVTTPMEDRPNVYNFRLQSNYSSYSTLYSGVAVTPHVIATVAHGLFDDENLVWTSDVRRIAANNEANYGYHLDEPTIRNLNQKVWTSYASRVGEETGESGSATLDTLNADFGAVYRHERLANYYAPTDIVSSDPYLWLDGDLPKKLQGFPLADPIPWTSQGRLHEIDLGTSGFKHWTDGRDSDGMPYMLFDLEGSESYGGNSGGPILAKDSNGNWQALAVFIGGTGSLFVRSFDNEAHKLVKLADEAAGGKGVTETKPSIFTAPDDILYRPGDYASIKVSASIGPSTTIDWYKDQKLLPDKNSLELVLDTNSSSTPGNYWMIAGNSKGTTVTSHINVKPYPPPTITSQSSDSYFWLNATASINVQYQSLIPATIQWYKDDVAIPNANSTSLFFAGEQTDAGIYTAQVQSETGTATSQPVKVSFFSIDAFNHSIPLELGIRQTISIPVQAPDEITYRWTTPSSIVETDTPELLLENTEESDLGDYQIALIAPDSSTLYERDFSAREKLPTVVADIPESTLYGKPFEPFKITIDVTGDYTPYVIQWYKNDTLIEGANDATLTLYPFQQSDSGTYRFTLVDSRGDSFGSQPLLVELDASGAPTQLAYSSYRLLPSSGKAEAVFNSSSYYNATIAQGSWVYQNGKSGIYSYIEHSELPDSIIYRQNLVDIAGCSWGFCALQLDGTLSVFEDFQETAQQSLGPDIVDIAMNDAGPIALDSQGRLHLLDAYRPSVDTPENHPNWKRLIRIEAEGQSLLALRSDQTLLHWDFATATSSILSQGHPIRDFDIAAHNIPVLFEDDTILQLGYQHTLSGAPANEPAPDLSGKSPLSLHATENFTFARLRDRTVHVWGKAAPIQSGGDPLTFANATYLADAVITSRHGYAIINNYDHTQTRFLPRKLVANPGDFFVARASGPSGKIRSAIWDRSGFRIPTPSHGSVFSNAASTDDLANYRIGPDFPLSEFAELDIQLSGEPSIYYLPESLEAIVGNPVEIRIGLNLPEDRPYEIQWSENGFPTSWSYSLSGLRYFFTREPEDSSYQFAVYSYGELLLESDPVQLTITPQKSYADWTQEKNLVPPADYWKADPDDDSLVNFVEYLFDSDPLHPAPLPIEFIRDTPFPVARFTLPNRQTYDEYEFQLDIPHPIQPGQLLDDIDQYYIGLGPNGANYEVPLDGENGSTLLFKFLIQKTE